MSSNTARPDAVPADLRRFRLEHALQALENALILLDSRPAEAIEISALERVRDDLAVLLRAAVAPSEPGRLISGSNRATSWVQSRRSPQLS